MVAKESSNSHTVMKTGMSEPESELPAPRVAVEFFKKNSLFPPFRIEDTPGTRGPGPSVRGPGLRHVCGLGGGLWLMVELKFGMSRCDCCLFTVE